MNSSTRPFISFIIPVYNSEKYLHRCIDSILGQTCQAFEIICVDDGSTDASGQILDSYAAKYADKIRVFHQENSGIAASRNRGIDLACGEYLAFVDNDDWIDSDWVMTLAKLSIDNDKPDVICSGYRRPDQDGKIKLDCSLDEKGEWSPFLIGAPWAKLYLTSYVHSHDLRFFSTNIGEDLPFVIPAVSFTDTIVVSSYCGYNWFYNNASVSNTIHKTSNGLMFEETLNHLFDCLNGTKDPLDSLEERYFIRLVAWYLFYTRKGDGLHISMTNIDRYSAWLDTHIPTWRKCTCATPFKPSGDSLPNRLAVWLYAKHSYAFKAMLTLYTGAN